MANTLIFYGDFTKAGVATAPSSAPTVAIYRVNRATGTESVAVAAGTAVTASALAGRYFYRLTAADLQTYDYHARFTTTDTSVDAADVPALWVRWSEAVATDAAGGVSATTVGDKSGYALAAAGLDPITVETGVNARQALSPILAAAAGVIAGAGTGTVTVKGGNAATTRITATTDGAGNRTAVTLVLPT